jgi:hypothetical protein
MRSEEYLKGYADGVRDRLRTRRLKQMNSRQNIIQQVVCEYFALPFSALRMKIRYEEILYPRQVLQYFLMKKTGLSCTTVGRFFEQDHTTVLWGVKKINDLIETDPNVRGDIVEIEKILKEKFNKEDEKNASSVQLSKGDTNNAGTIASDAEKGNMCKVKNFPVSISGATGAHAQDSRGGRYISPTG